MLCNHHEGPIGNYLLITVHFAIATRLVGERVPFEDAAVAEGQPPSADDRRSALTSHYLDPSHELFVEK